MTDHFARPDGPASSPRVRELLQLAGEDYASNAVRRAAQDHRDDVVGLAEPPALRCPAAHPEDPTPCGGPIVVTVLDRNNAGANGCEHHGARLLASLDGGRVYALPDAPAGSAIRTFKTAGTLAPFAWLNPERGERR